MTLDTDPDAADAVDLYQAFLGKPAVRVQPGSIQVRDWTKWDEEHKVLHAHGTYDEIMRHMEDEPTGSGHQERFPERYDPNRGYGKHLKHGETRPEIVEKTGTFPMRRTLVSKYWEDTAEEERKGRGMPMTTPDGKHVIDVPVKGSERPTPLYRVMSEEEWQQAKQRGYIQSDGRLNLGSHEGTVTSVHTTGTFYMQPGLNRMVRIRPHPADGWKFDHDGYVKTQSPIPIERVDMVSRPLDYGEDKPTPIVRVEPGSLNVRDWAKWHAEHPYEKHPRSKHTLWATHKHTGEKYPVQAVTEYHVPEQLIGHGTKASPFKTNDPERAAKLLIAGHYVQLSQPRQVSTLLDKLSEYVHEAKAKNGEIPDLNLCRISVPHTNLFCAGNKGIERLKMPQLSGKPIPGSKADAFPKDKSGEVDLGPAFIEHLRSKGISVTNERIEPQFLHASQSELDGSKVSGMYGAIHEGQLTEAPIFVSKDDYVVDGHHRWAANIAAAYDDGVADEQIPVHRVDMPIIDILFGSLCHFFHQ